MSKLNRTIILGEGYLSWIKPERQTDRWGSVILGKDKGYISFDNAPTGQYARLVIVPLKADGGNDDEPAVGTEVELGVGTVFTDSYQTREDPAPLPIVGVEPADGRTEDWMSSDALYNSHFQTVRLEARPA